MPVCCFFDNIFFFWLSYFVISCFIVNVTLLSNSKNLRMFSLTVNAFVKELLSTPRYMCLLPELYLINCLSIEQWCLFTFFGKLTTTPVSYSVYFLSWNSKCLGANIFNILPAKSSGFPLHCLSLFQLLTCF